MLTFATLGPAASNHAFVLARYLRMHGLAETARTWFVDDFERGASLVLTAQADYLLQCAAHPAFADTTGRHRAGMVPVDAFVAPSQPMALVRARGARSDGVVGIQEATRHYADLSAFAHVQVLPTVSAVQEALLADRIDAGIAFASLAQAHPHRFEVLQDVGAVCDAWVLFGRDAVAQDEPVVWLQSPVARQFVRA